MKSRFRKIQSNRRLPGGKNLLSAVINLCQDLMSLYMWVAALDYLKHRVTQSKPGQPKQMAAIAAMIVNER